MQILKLDYNKFELKPYHYSYILVGLFLTGISLSFKRVKLLKLNINGITHLKKFDHAKTYLNLPSPIIWSVKVENDESHQISIYSSKWDTLLKTPVGTQVNYTFWQYAKNGFHQTTNLSNNNGTIQVGLYSPIYNADTTIINAGKVILDQFQSVEYTPSNLATIRLNSKSTEESLIYCIFGIDSIVPVALNTDNKDIPEHMRKIKNLKPIPNNKFQFRARWNSQRIFIINLSSSDKKSNVTIEFFPG
ncbi:hypothetical protein [Tenacibaculum xiamenense]|uniref:hypothetical protein n=1 Tax=Tenacibaculum xiamenense TaxID=1261553 RepID=UPI0038B438D3